MDKAKLVLRVLVGLWRWEHLEIWIRKATSLLPEVNATLRAGSQNHGRLLRAVLAFGVRSDVLHIIAPYLVLRAISTDNTSALALTSNSATLTIEGMSRRNECAVVCKFYSLSGFSCDFDGKGQRLGLPSSEILCRVLMRSRSSTLRRNKKVTKTDRRGDAGR